MLAACRAALTLKRMSNISSIFRALLMLMASLGLLQNASAIDQFQGTFSSGPHVVRIHQVGSRVCGEWNYVTERSNREGLVAGVVSNGTLLLTECDDFSLSCKPVRETEGKSIRFVLLKGNLEIPEGNWEGSNHIFRKSSSARPKWTNAQARENAQFLSRCIW